jgi:hypothetical protein
VTRDQADAQLEVIAAAHEQAHPDDDKNQDLVVGTPRPSRHQHQAARRHAHPGADGNTAGTRGDGAADVVHESREHHVGVRIGASEGDRDPLGLLTATWAAQWLVSSMPTVFPIFLALDLTSDTTVLFATMIFCSLATVAFGLWPALRLSRPDLVSSLKDHAGDAC